MTTGWAGLLADGETASKTGSVGPGLAAFVVVMLLVVATAFLMRSMVKQIRKIPPSFDDEPGATAPGPEPQPPSAADPDDLR